MEYRDIEYSVILDANRDSRKWSVSLSESTAQSGNAQNREAALTAVVSTIDRLKARAPKIEANPARAGGYHAAVV